MSFFEAVIRALIYLCLVALAFFLCLWVLSVLGVALPPIVVTILKVIFVLVAILMLVRLFHPWLAGFSLFPPRPPAG